MRIRTARRSDLPLLQDIERVAGEPFRALGMSAIADDDPPPLGLLDDYRRAGRAWVAAGPDDRPAGYLIAFSHVPWNAPYYARLGFRTLGEAELTDGLRKIRAEEAEHGLDRWPRVCMRREIPRAGNDLYLSGTDRQL